MVAMSQPKHFPSGLPIHGNSQYSLYLRLATYLAIPRGVLSGTQRDE